MATTTRYAPSPSKRKRAESEATHDTVGSLPARPIAKAAGHARKRSTVGSLADAASVVDATGDLNMQRHELSRIFSAIETCLLSDRSIEATFHSLRDAVSEASRIAFELHHLARIAGVWPDCYRLGPAHALYRGVRTPTVSIAWPTGEHTDSTARLGNALRQQERKRTFTERLAQWAGQSGALPDLAAQTPSQRVLARAASLRRPEERSTTSTAGVQAGQTLASESAESKQARQDALLDRIRAKALAKAAEPTADERQLATLRALAPQAIMSIKVLLASRTVKSLGLKELVDNLVTSLRRRLGPEETERLVEVIALDHPHWCKIGRVGDVACVRFSGNSP